MSLPELDSTAIQNCTRAHFSSIVVSVIIVFVLDFFVLDLVNEFIIFSFLPIFVLVFVNENHTVLNKRWPGLRLIYRWPSFTG